MSFYQHEFHVHTIENASLQPHIDTDVLISNVIIACCAIGSTQYLCLHFHEALFITFCSRPKLRTMEGDKAGDIAVNFGCEMSANVSITKNASRIALIIGTEIALFWVSRNDSCISLWSVVKTETARNFFMRNVTNGEASRRTDISYSLNFLFHEKEELADR